MEYPHMPWFSLSQRSLLTSLITTSLLAACGAGSDDPPRAPYVSPVERSSVTQVPAPTYTDAWKLSAFNRLNEVRQQAGIGLLAQNATIDIAAQNHSSYLVNHSLTGHIEPQSGSDSTGGDSSARINHVENPAYPVKLEYNSSTEVTSTVEDMGIRAQSGKELIDGLMGTPYHRSALLTPEWADVGIGFDGRGTYANITIDIASNPYNIQGAPQTPYIIWPPDGSTDIPTAMGTERPNPIPENNGAVAGYAVSIQTNRRLDTGLGNVSVFEIRDPSGAVVPTKLLTVRTDPNLTPLGAGAFIAALPRAPLAKNTRYQVVFKADLQKGGAIFQEDKPMEKTWSFTTGEKLYY
jgi:uncharacterized protein YkwD